MYQPASGAAAIGTAAPFTGLTAVAAPAVFAAKCAGLDENSYTYQSTRL